MRKALEEPNSPAVAHALQAKKPGTVLQHPTRSLTFEFYYPYGQGLCHALRIWTLGTAIGSEPTQLHLEERPSHYSNHGLSGPFIAMLGKDRALQLLDLLASSIH